MATKKEGRETGAGEMPNFNNAATCQVQKVDKKHTARVKTDIEAHSPNG